MCRTLIYEKTWAQTSKKRNTGAELRREQHLLPEILDGFPIGRHGRACAVLARSNHNGYAGKHTHEEGNIYVHLPFEKPTPADLSPVFTALFQSKWESVPGGAVPLPLARRCPVCWV